jgi:hypothetical protein
MMQQQQQQQQQMFKVWAGLICCIKILNKTSFNLV